MGFLGTSFWSLSQGEGRLHQENGVLEKWQHTFLLAKDGYLFLPNYNVFSGALMVPLIVFDCALSSLISMIVNP